jgi:3-hydroxyacyl-[acyl-carrier-protein] dehydratase
MSEATMSANPVPAELATLTHAVPLTALNRVVSMTHDQIVTEKDVRAEEPYFRGHYVNFPVYPGVFMVEAVDQAVRLFGLRNGMKLGLVEVKTRFLSAVGPGDTLRCECTIKSDENQRLRTTSTCYNNGVKAAQVRGVYENRGALHVQS